MAYVDQRLGYHHAQADTQHAAYFEEDDSAVLDPAILDGADIMQSPNSVPFRKDSFVPSTGVLSPADSHGWEAHYSHGLAVEPNPLYKDNNGFVSHPGTHPAGAIYGHPHGPQWAFDQSSGNCTPTTDVAFMPPPPHFDGQGYMHHRADSAHLTYGHPPPAQPAFNGPHPEANFMPAPQVQTPMSPHSHQDWMGMAQQEMECRPISKRMRPNSPSSTMVDLQRRDGIRKKNGRIDIPLERNIHTIDEMIDKAEDEGELRELKSQKRLLRNREAA